jgi:hypothetical protein
VSLAGTITLYMADIYNSLTRTQNSTVPYARKHFLPQKALVELLPASASIRSMCAVVVSVTWSHMQSKQEISKKSNVLLPPQTSVKECSMEKTSKLS